MDKTCLVSIPAPLARSNFSGLARRFGTSRFNTCSSCEEQPAAADTATRKSKFQYLLLLRGATCHFHGSCPECGFNTCSSCEEQRRRQSGSRYRSCVSIPAPLARSNSGACGEGAGSVVSIPAPLARSNYMAGIRKGLRMFQYLLLLRGATAPLVPGVDYDEFQYLLLLRGATRRAGLVL